MIFLGVDITDNFSPLFFNYITYFDALIVGLLWTFSFIIMVNQRLNSEMSEAKKHFELIFETSPDASVISRLSDGLLINSNEGYTRISGYSKEEIIGKSSIDINIWKDPADRQKIIDLIIEKGFCENIEILFQHKNGSVITGLMSAKTITLKGVTHIISVTRDISDLKHVEEQLRLKNEQLVELNSEKNKFFSIIAHDLRSPFNSFLGLTQILSDELSYLTKEDINTMADSMKRSATSIYRLLENLLQWARIQQGLVPLKLKNIGLLWLINESMTMVIESAKSKEIEITSEVPSDFEIFADSNILQIVIRNLISNAIKFTPKGGKVIISAKTTPDFIEIAIKDNGIGMDKEMIDTLFRLDVKTSRVGTEGEQSTGLGLILCKDFVEKQGGRLWVESEEGKGSVFCFTVPLKFDVK
jgi:PAS domain S-box-containing protein